MALVSIHYLVIIKRAIASQMNEISRQRVSQVISTESFFYRLHAPGRLCGAEAGYQVLSLLNIKCAYPSTELPCTTLHLAFFDGGKIWKHPNCGAFGATCTSSKRINKNGRLNSHDVDLLIFRRRRRRRHRHRRRRCCTKRMRHPPFTTEKRNPKKKTKSIPRNGFREIRMQERANKVGWAHAASRRWLLLHHKFLECILHNYSRWCWVLSQCRIVCAMPV